MRRSPGRIHVAIAVALALVSTATPQETPPAVSSAAPVAPAPKPAAFEIRDGDRIALVGSAFIEREPASGYIEAILKRRFPDAAVRFRNLGWSGDDVRGASRAGFDPPESGFGYLIEHVKSVRPTLIVLGYGSVESFDGPGGLERFRADLARLLDELAAIAPRIVILSPLRHENLGPPLPDPESHNRDLELYSGALRRAAAERGLIFVDILDLRVGPGEGSAPPGPLTDNGIHLTPYGYWVTALAIERALGLTPPEWRVEIDLTRGVLLHGARLLSYEVPMPGAAAARPDGPILRLRVRDALLPAPVPPVGSPARAFELHPGRMVRIQSLPAGRYALLEDGEAIAAGSDAEWALGVTLRTGAAFARTRALRRAIIDKNFAYFQRWRPQNTTYLFGFRKHEQGQNAREMADFDRHVEDLDRAIDEIDDPREHTYELVPIQEVTR